MKNAIIAKILALSAWITTIITILIFCSMFFEALRFFSMVNIVDFLFGLSWTPENPENGELVNSTGFGIVPLVTGTLLITIIAILVAGILGLSSAIYLSQYASNRLHATLKPILEILAGIPTVVYGYFAIATIAPFVKSFASIFGLTMSTESALVAGLVMGIMISPSILSMSDDALRNVPMTLRDASIAMGATVSESIRFVILPAAMPAIFGAFIIGISRAIGETMIVVMAAGLMANLTFNPLDSVTTMTVQIVSMLVGDQEFNSAKTLSAFGLGITLFVMTFLLNIAALVWQKKYRAKYGNV